MKLLKSSTNKVYVKDMGLGKTLSVLALICSSLDTEVTTITGTENEAHRGTLIITPKSSRFHLKGVRIIEF